MSDRGFSTFPEMSSLGRTGLRLREGAILFLPYGNWALCAQMSVSVKAWVFSSFPRQSPDQSCCCNPRPVSLLLSGQAPTGRERLLGPSCSKLELFTVFSWIWPWCGALDSPDRCNGPPLSVTQPRPRPERHRRPTLHCETQTPDVNTSHRWELAITQPHQLSSCITPGSNWFHHHGSHIKLSIRTIL